MKKFKATIHLYNCIEGCKQGFNGFYIEGDFPCCENKDLPDFPSEVLPDFPPTGLYFRTPKGFQFIPYTSIKYIDCELIDEE